ncbi:hypothetical protein [Lactobacillus acetotolerans]|jgi:hypothetical protein|uniref:Sigma-70 family RNA polymerase sigma factor n=1 Tax=Lactobacillus acetotolerans TaxID=1600 RepID=A0A5P5ZJ80_9LACO|nr:hypothetical protein [Lactobacillus acetotolerans]KRN41472.1 RNA polymerase sigma factor [Lactobacillus acetotolerans DSM 20749 = JCM 3825]QFG50681.1 sigma-70 family RNA polymerase sigma factor [Lactobacillus acetotolerans]QJD72673.1 sigma-70 family RNA polymerase sigma factor [Lactobacillus acetotolerans]GGV12539.1 hypothetical protein GCM10011628_07520 [Lactobacillus acetotolerans DSM 20749 = JCM 3825]HBQ43845.1 RNA polymerase subunit sigma [Lactobacillus acetotolerans]
MKISQKNFLTAWENRKLVYGAMKKLHIYKDYSDYEDLLQDGVCLYAQMLEEHPDMSREEVDKLSFRKIIWNTTDRLRKIQRNDEHRCNVLECSNLAEAVHWDDLIVLKDEVNKMSKIEQIIFFEHLLFENTFSSLVIKYGINRKQLQRLKHKLLIKLQCTLKE